MYYAMITITNVISIHHYTIDFFTHFAYPQPSSPLVTTNPFPVSMSLLLFHFVCSIVLFLCFYIPPMSEIIQHLSFSIWHFTWHTTFQVHPCSNKWQNFILFDSWVVFHRGVVCVCVCVYACVHACVHVHHIFLLGYCQLKLKWT